MTKPTGRPKGRPKTKEYETLMARVPQELADRARRYAGLHHQTISMVIRDGLEMLLEEERFRPWVSETNGDAENLSDRKGDTPGPAVRQVGIVSDTKADDATILSNRNKATTALLSDGETGGENLSDTKATMAPLLSDTKEDGGKQPAILSDTKEAQGERFPRTPTPAILSDSIPATVSQYSAGFDSTRYALGELCVHGHNYHGTRQSVRRLSDRECLECHAARARTYRQRQRQARRSS